LNQPPLFSGGFRPVVARSSSAARRYADRALRIGTNHLIGIPVVRVLNVSRDPQFRLLLLLADSLFGRFLGGLPLSGLS
jgi:hypothetical protein